MSLERRVDGRLYSAGCGSALDLNPHEPVQHRAGILGLGTELLQRAIELEQVNADLLDLGTLRFVRAVRGGNEQAEDEGGHGRDEAHHQLHHVLGVALEVVVRQSRVQPQAGQRSTERECEHQRGYDG